MGRGKSKARKNGSRFKLNLQFFAQSPKKISEMSDKELRKAIRSSKKAIAEHEEHINNPTTKAPDYNSFGKRHQQGLIRWWQKEIEGQKEQLADFEKELKRRTHNE